METSDKLFKIHKNETFEGVILVLDYHSFENCTIKNCTLIYGGGPCHLIGTEVGNSNFDFRDGALRTLQIYHNFIGRSSGIDDKGNIKI